MAAPEFVDGIDVSKWQGAGFPWEAAKAAGLKFAFARAALGNTYRDGTYESNMRAMRNVGLEKRGAYYVPTLAAPIGVADYIRNFEGQLMKAPKPHWIAIDVQHPKSGLADNQKSKARQIVWDLLEWSADYLGGEENVFCYTGEWWWDPNFGGYEVDGKSFDKWQLWAAYYADNNTCAWPPGGQPEILPRPWEIDADGNGYKNWRIWQICSTHKQPWYNGNLDWNKMRYSAWLRAGGAPIDDDGGNGNGNGNGNGDDPPPDGELASRVANLEGAAEIVHGLLRKMHGAFHS